MFEQLGALSRRYPLPPFLVSVPRTALKVDQGERNANAAWRKMSWQGKAELNSTRTHRVLRGLDFTGQSSLTLASLITAAHLAVSALM